ncbi:MAG: archease [Candidatus Thermoplasmatota archaeon]|nr:archease [Candidatus Thermoplasmatota archaeon]
MYEILNHQADTRIRIFDTDFKGLLTSIIQSFKETVFGKTEGLQFTDEEYLKSVLKWENNLQFLAVDVFNELIFLMEEKDLFPIELKDFATSKDNVEITVRYGKYPHSGDLNAIPKAATMNKSDDNGDFIDVTLDL